MHASRLRCSSSSRKHIERSAQTQTQTQTHFVTGCCQLSTQVNLCFVNTEIHLCAQHIELALAALLTRRGSREFSASKWARRSARRTHETQLATATNKTKRRIVTRTTLKHAHGSWPIRAQRTKQNNKRTPKRETSVGHFSLLSFSLLFLPSLFSSLLSPLRAFRGSSLSSFGQPK